MLPNSSKILGCLTFAGFTATEWGIVLSLVLRLLTELSTDKFLGSTLQFASRIESFCGALLKSLLKVELSRLCCINVVTSCAWLRSPCMTDVSVNFVGDLLKIFFNRVDTR